MFTSSARLVVLVGALLCAPALAQCPLGQEPYKRNGQPDGCRSTIATRRDANTVVGSALRRYRRAWKQMNAMYDYQDFANIHGVAPVELSDALRPTCQYGIFNICSHHIHTFGEWHRPFVRMIEQWVQAADEALMNGPNAQLDSIDYSEKLGLLYWPWSDTPGQPYALPTPAVHMPAAWRDATAEVDTVGVLEPNPLYAFVLANGKTTTRGDSGPYPTTGGQNANLGSPQYIPKVTVHADLTRSPGAAIGAVEAGHDNVHVMVGNTMVSGGSALDPVFFGHHANVDRLYQTWYERQSPGPPGTNNRQKYCSDLESKTISGPVTINRVVYNGITATQAACNGNTPTLTEAEPKTPLLPWVNAPGTAFPQNCCQNIHTTFDPKLDYVTQTNVSCTTMLSFQYKYDHLVDFGAALLEDPSHYLVFEIGVPKPLLVAVSQDFSFHNNTVLGKRYSQLSGNLDGFLDIHFLQGSGKHHDVSIVVPVTGAATLENVHVSVFFVDSTSGNDTLHAISGAEHGVHGYRILTAAERKAEVARSEQHRGLWIKDATSHITLGADFQANLHVTPAGDLATENNFLVHGVDIFKRLEELQAEIDSLKP